MGKLKRPKKAHKEKQKGNRNPEKKIGPQTSKPQRGKKITGDLLNTEVIGEEAWKKMVFGKNKCQFPGPNTMLGS